MFALSLGTGLNVTYKVNIVATDLLYENTGTLTQGRLGGLLWRAQEPTTEINLAGTNIIDNGGGGGTNRGDIMGLPVSISPTKQPILRNVGSKIASVINV